MIRCMLVISIGLLASGCALGPDYQRPELQIPETYGQQSDTGESVVNLPWWEVFRDKHLQNLISIALEENKDIAIAAARVEEARARFGFTRADQFPRIDVAANANRGDPGVPVGDPRISEQYRLAAELSFELDIWGRLRRSTESARAELLATEEARRTVIVTLVADLASAYVLLRDADQRLAISVRTVASRQDSLKIIRARFDKGTVPLLDVNQAEIEEAEAAVSLATTERQIIESENLISVLLGRNPGPVLRNRNANEDPVHMPAVPAGLPAELLQRRPDVRQAEYALAAQTARIGAAQALRLPTLSLTGAFGLASNELSGFNDSDAVTWNIGAGLLGPLFDFGKSKRQVDIERARTEQLLKQYENIVLQSLREVENALVGIRTRSDELSARQRQLVAARSASKLSRARYDGGIVSYLEVLDSERSLFNAELAESATHRDSLVSMIELYKALGGGWEPQTASPQ